MELRDFLPIPDLERCSSLLCIQPHPDDNEVGAGATIARLSRKGCRITYLTITDGRNGTLDPLVEPENLAEIRKKEVLEASKILGISSLVFLDYKDAEYPEEKKLCRSITAVIRKVRPEFVMTVDPFLPYEAHPDHRRVGMATAEACIFSPFPHFYSDDGETESSVWEVRGIAFYSTAYPNTFINVDDTWDLKINALSAHKSQFDPQMLEKLKYYFDFKSRQYAEGRGFLRAEAFKVLAPAYLHMSVDTLAL